MNVAERRDEGCEVVVVGYRVLHDINKLSRVRVAKTADARATTIVKHVLVWRSGAMILRVAVLSEWRPLAKITQATGTSTTSPIQQDLQVSSRCGRSHACERNCGQTSSCSPSGDRR